MKSYVRMTKEQEYKVFETMSDAVAQQVVASVLYSLRLEGFRKRRLQKAFENIKSIIEFPEFMGKSLDGIEMIEYIKDMYGIDCREIKIKKESEREYLKSNKNF